MDTRIFIQNKLDDINLTLPHELSLLTKSVEEKNPEMVKRQKETIIRFENKEIVGAEVIAKGGTKTIIDLGNGYVIGVIEGSSKMVEKAIDMHVSIADNLHKIGLETQEYEKKIIYINDNPNPWPVLMMPSFAALAMKGRYVFDPKIFYFSSPIYIFGKKENLLSTSHWQKILEEIIHDITIYIMNHLDFGWDSFNLVIQDKKENKNKEGNAESKLFCELGKEIRFYFSDFSVHHSCKKNELVKIDGSVSDISLEFLFNEIFRYALTAIFDSVSTEEYFLMMGEYPQNLGPIKLEEEAQQILNMVKSEALQQAKNIFQEYLNTIPIEERIKKYIPEDLIDKRKQEAAETEKINMMIVETKRRIAELKQENEKRLQEETERARLKAIAMQFEIAKQKRKDEQIDIEKNEANKNGKDDEEKAKGYFCSVI